MHCNNFLNVKHWLNEFENKNIIIRRYPYVKIEHISPEDPAVILMENLKEWLSGGDHTTFWHLKQLFINLKSNAVKLPIVMTLLRGKPFIDPGGSRITVLKYLGEKTVSVDLIYPKKELKDIEIGEFRQITDAEEFIKPYELIGINYKMDMCYTGPCVTCIDNKVIHNGDYRYSITWENPWYYHDDYYKWYEKNKNFKTEKLMDWYFV